ncbi:hypothetical protein NMG60_11004210 [Bertholletia excelsa]
MEIEERRQSKRVCVVGAGPSGLVAARELRKEGHEAVVFEQNHDVGGQWLYDPNVDSEDVLGKGTTREIHSSVYASLRVITPREMMGYSDFPFVVKKEEGRDTRRFPGHREVFLYLKEFSEWFGLREMIRFNTRVEYVGPLDYGENFEDLKWAVRSKEKKTEKVFEEVFDAVVVANGHYSQPWVPAIKGMDAWRGRQIHSHIYRVPDPFRNEVVVVVGNFNSGQDISMELSRVAKEVHLSVKLLNDIWEGQSKFISKHDNFHLHPQIDSLKEGERVEFIDGSCVIADTIIYCTGYSYSFPFLDTKGLVQVQGNRVEHLYDHTFPPPLAPSLSFVGIQRRVLGFPFFEIQGKWIAQVLSGKRKLPSQEDMMKSIMEFYHQRELEGIPKHRTHDIGRLEYTDEYAEHCGSLQTEEWRKQICLSTIRRAIADLETYRDSEDQDLELLQLVLQSPLFVQFGPENAASA